MYLFGQVRLVSQVDHSVLAAQFLLVALVLHADLEDRFHHALPVVLLVQLGPTVPVSQEDLVRPVDLEVLLVQSRLSRLGLLAVLVVLGDHFHLVDPAAQVKFSQFTTYCTHI